MARSTNSPAASKTAAKAEPTPASPAPDAAAAAAEVDVKIEVTEDVANFELAFQTIAVALAKIKEVQATLKGIQKQYNKLSKTKTKRAKGTGGNATPSGFVKPAPLSDALAAFLGLDNGSSLPRTEVTKRVNEYVKANNLQNPSDRRTILPDAKLKALLNPGQDDNVTYFNLQRYLKPHFIKIEA